MPNLGPGVDNHINLTPSAVLVFTPTPNAPATVRFANEGSGGTVYLGGIGVTPQSGFPLIPGNAPIKLQNVNVSLYACSGYATTAAATTLTAPANAGGTSLAITSGTGTVTGQYVLVGAAGAGQEVVQITAGGGTATLTVTPLLYDHKTAGAVQAASALPAQLRSTAGVV
jgi:hypothetical protein